MSAILESLSNSVKLLAAAREAAAKAKAVVDAKRTDFEASIADDVAIAAQMKNEVAALESEVKATALVCYELDASTKSVAAGVSIKIRKEYAINEAEALAWAIEKNLCLIPQSLDVKAVEKLATVQVLPFVQVNDVPSVTIATDLSKALASEVMV